MDKPRPSRFLRDHVAEPQGDPWTGQGTLFPLDTPDHLLPTNATAARYPVHRWFGFVPGFSPEYVRGCVTGAGLSDQDTVLDPFAGCGTTLVECNALGISSIGFEPHPFLADICRAKLLMGADPGIVTRIRSLLETVSTVAPTNVFSEAALSFLVKLLPRAALERLAAARRICSTFSGDEALLARLIVSRVLDLCSHSKTDGIYKAPTSRKTATDYLSALRLVCSEVTADLATCTRGGIRNRSRLLEESSERMTPDHARNCKLLITSPPYVNNFDFAEMTRMYLYFWGYASSWAEITARVRAKLIVNTTTSLSRDHRNVSKYRDCTPACVHDILDAYCKRLARKRQVKAGKKQYDLIIYPYFAQMTSVMKASRALLAPGAQVKIIVSDAALYGVHIRADEVLGSILEAIGFENVQLRRLRARGTRWILDKREGSPDGLGEYELSAREPLG